MKTSSSSVLAVSVALLLGLAVPVPALAQQPAPSDVAAVGAAGAVTGPDRPGPVAVDLVVNGGFERGTAAAADGWTSSSSAATSFGGEAHDGQRALTIAWSNASSPANRGVTSAPVAVHSSRIKTVRLTGWVKLTNVVKGASQDNTGKVFVNFRKADGGSLGWFGTGGLVGTTEGWQRIDQVIAVPANTTNAVTNIALDRATGTMLADGIALTPETWNNLVPNPGFEQLNTNASTSATSPALSWFTPWQSDTYGLDTQTFAEGSRAMRVDGIARPKDTAPSGGGASIGKIGAAVTVTGLDASTWPLVRVSAKVRLADVAMADYAAFPGAARVSLSFSYVKDGATVYSGSGLLGGIMEGDKDWATISGTFRVPPLTTRLTVIPTVQTSTGTMWVDDVRVTPETSIASPAEQIKMTDGAATPFLVTVTNTTGRAQAFSVVPDAVDASAAASVATTASLQPGQTETVQVTVAPSQGAAEANVRVHVVPAAGTTGAETILLTARTAQPSPASADPGVFSTPPQLDGLRDRVANRPWAQTAFSKTVANADDWLSRPLDQPVSHGGWSGDFKCPGSNTSLTWDANSPTKHRCATTGQYVEGDDRVNRAWIEIWHNNAATAAADLALASQLLPHDDPRVSQYTAKARDILVYYADRYPSVPLNPLYGKVHYQSLDEAVSLLSLTDAYDLIRGGIDAGSRVAIEGNLLRPVAEMLVSVPQATSNFQAWTTAAVYAVGAAIDDPVLRDWALNDPTGGARFLLGKAVLSDGWWWEGSASYHLYALQALTQLAIAAKNVGDADLPNEPTFRSMHYAILPYLYPDMTIPASGDGGNWGRQYGPSSTAFAEWAFGQYGDPEFAVGLAHAYQDLGTLRSDPWALRYGADEIPSSTGPRQESATFRGLGETVLRSHGADNLVQNGNLEEASLTSAGLPRSWTLNGASWSDDSFLGSRGLTIESGQSASAAVRVDGRETASLRLRAMVSGADVQDARLVATFADANGATVGTQQIDVDARAGWSAQDAALQVPPAAQSFVLRAEAGGGTLQLDKLDIWDDDLLSNGDFEHGADDWVAVGDATVGAPAARGDGAAQLRGAAGAALLSADIPAVGARVHTMRLTADIDTEQLTGPGTIGVDYLRAGGEVVAGPRSELAPASGWNPVSVDLTLPQDAIAVRVRVAVEASAGALAVDNVSLVATAATDATQTNAIRVDHGVSGGTHGHADKLHIDVTGGGALSSTDLGQVYGASNADLTANWYKETVAHNTVVVDGRSQDFDVRGALESFASTDNLQVVSAGVAAPYRTAPSQSDVSLNRQLLMTDDYTLDVFDAIGTAEHRFDQSWHAEGSLDSPADGGPSCGDPGCVLDPSDADFGYRQIAVRAEGSKTNWQADWTSPSAAFTLRSLDGTVDDLIEATAPGVASSGAPMDLLLVRRDGVASTRYTTLLETRSKAQPSVIDSAEKVEDGHVRVLRTTGARDDLLYATAAQPDSGSALVRWSGSGDVDSIDVFDRSDVVVSGVSLLQATAGGQAWTIPGATVMRDGSALRVSMARPDSDPAGGVVTLDIAVPGIDRVEVNGQIQCTSVMPDGIRAFVPVGDTAENPCEAPSAPRNISALVDDGRADLLWTAPLSDGGSAVTGYRLQLRSGGGEWSDVAATVETNAKLTSLQNGTAYEFRVAAVNAAGLGGWSTTLSATPAVNLDRTLPTATVKQGAAFTEAGSDGAYRMVSFKLNDAGKIDRVVLNGVVKNLADNVWSDVNFLRPGVFGAVVGVNSLVVYDVGGNSSTVEFTLEVS